MLVYESGIGPVMVGIWDFGHHPNVGKYTSPMDPMGMGWFNHQPVIFHGTICFLSLPGAGLEGHDTLFLEVELYSRCHGARVDSSLGEKLM